ncbi:hypothetical protein GCM10022243_42640 [Saccharothrix violaceirubra]
MDSHQSAPATDPASPAERRRAVPPRTAARGSVDDTRPTAGRADVVTPPDRPDPPVEPRPPGVSGAPADVPPVHSPLWRRRVRTNVGRRRPRATGR